MPKMWCVIDSWCYYVVLTFKCAHINQSKYDFIARQLTHSILFSHASASSCSSASNQQQINNLLELFN